MAPSIKRVDTGVRGVFGVLLFAFFLFSALSLFSFDWNDIACLKAREAQTPANLIGPAGAWMSWFLFVLFGVGAYAVPLWFLIMGMIVFFNRDENTIAKLLWASLMMLMLMLTPELDPSVWQAKCNALNIGDWTSGVFGLVLMKNFLVKLLSPIGAGIVVWSVFAASLLMIVGVHGFASALSWIKGLCSNVRGRVDEKTLETRERRKMLEQEQREIEKERRQLEREMIRREREEEKARRKQEKAERRAALEAGKNEEEKEPPPRKERKQQAIEEPVSLAAGMSSSSCQGYQLPPISLLGPIPSSKLGIQTDTSVTGKAIVETLNDFGIESAITHVEKGPVVTLYEILPAPGVKVERIAGLANNLALSLKATSVRVQAPIPGKGVVGVEVPNTTANMVVLRQIMESEAWVATKAHLPVALGKDVSGQDKVADLADMPHLLVAGATGAGKTVCMNSILAGLLMSRTPEQLKLMLVDPKIVEFACYNDIPHLVAPVITDPKKVALGLRWAINEMENRYKLFARAGVRNIEGYNNRASVVQTELFDAGEDVKPETQPVKKGGSPERIPYIVIVVDELADLMLSDGAEIEICVARLAQLSRAVGIHMILSTQRPSVNVITGTIKANFPARIAFQVAQKVDSRTILDAGGAEKLLGKGDMLFLPPGSSKMIRIQGAMTSDEDIKAITGFIKRNAKPEFDLEIKDKLDKPAAMAKMDSGEEDELLNQAIDIIRETQRASTSSLQRRLRIGYTRAARIIDILEERGILGPPRGSDPREILVDLDGGIPNNEQISGPVEEEGNPDGSW